MTIVNMQAEVSAAKMTAEMEAVCDAIITIPRVSAMATTITAILQFQSFFMVVGF